MSIFVCIMTLFCPVVCMAGLEAHQGEHGQIQDVPHATKNCQHPGQEHDPNGDPAPHGEHSCLCTGGTPPGAAVQVPSLEPVAIIAADELFVAALAVVSTYHRADARGPTDPTSSSRCTPLLI